MTNEKTEKQLLEEINKRLAQIAGLLAIQGKGQEEQIKILTALGFDSNTIGLFVGMTGDAVRKRRTRNKSQ